MDASSGDGVRWSKGGSRAAAGGGDGAAAANLPERRVGVGLPVADGRADGDANNDAAQIQALLHSLSEVRLAVSADLSAAAGALEDDRADVAADVIAGARRELAVLRAAARLRESVPSPSPRKVPVTVGGSGGADPQAAPEPRVPGQQIPRPRRRLPRALAGAAALAVAIAVVPQLAGASSHRSNSAAGVTSAEQSPDIRLASSEFTVLSQRLLAADAAPAAIVDAERRWHSAVASSLPNASTQVVTASAVVTMLRQERGLLLASPALRTPANRALATTLAASSQALLTQLRQLADPQVLAILPTVLNALPLPVPGTTTAPKAIATPSTGTTTAPAGSTPGTGSTTDPTAPSPGANPSAPSPTPGSAPPASNGPLPIPDPGNVLPLPLPSTLGQLAGGDTDSGGLGETVGSVLNGLGLGG